MLQVLSGDVLLRFLGGIFLQKGEGSVPMGTLQKIFIGDMFYFTINQTCEQFCTFK